MEIEVVVLNESHRSAFADFSRLVWGSAAEDKPAAPDRPANPYSADSPCCNTVLVTEGRIIGNLTSTACKVWSGGQETFMHWVSGFHLLPETRGKGLAKLLVQKMMEVHPVLSAVVVVEASRRSFTASGWQFDWKIPEYVKILDAPGFVGKFTGAGLRSVPPALQWLGNHLQGPSRVVLGGVAGVANGAYQAAWRLAHGRSTLAVQPVEAFGPEVDALWLRNRDRLTCAQVRQSGYLNFMFPAQDGWRKLVALDGERVVGYAVVSVATFESWQGLRGITLASVIDMFWDLDRAEVAHALLAESESLARSRGAHVLLCSGTDVRARRAAVGAGFLPIPGTVWYGYHSSDPQCVLPVARDQWFANRGDADAAGSLGPTA